MSTKLKKLKKILKIVNEAEESGTVSFSRHGADMVISIHSRQHNDPTQWANAYKLQDQLGVYGRQLEPDAMSGNLFMRLCGVYEAN